MKIVCRPTARYRRVLREQWVQHYGFYCAYCLSYCESDYTVDHIIPRSKGGRNTFLNMVIACLKCNQEKRDCMPDEFKELKLQPLPYGYLNRLKETTGVEHDNEKIAL